MAIIRLDPWQTVRRIQCKKEGKSEPKPKTVHPRRTQYFGVNQVFEFAWFGPADDEHDGPFEMIDNPPGDHLTLQAPFVDENTDLFFYALFYAPFVGHDALPTYPIGACEATCQIAGASGTAYCVEHVETPAVIGPVAVESGQMLTFSGSCTITEQTKTYGGVQYYNLCPVARIVALPPPE